MNDETPNWSPATSQPGEMFTPEGRIRGIGVAAQNLARSSPRSRRYQRQMIAMGVRVAALAGLVIVLVAIIMNAVS